MFRLVKVCYFQVFQHIYLHDRGNFSGLSQEFLLINLRMQCYTCIFSVRENSSKTNSIVLRKRSKKQNVIPTWGERGGRHLIVFSRQSIRYQYQTFFRFHLNFLVNVEVFQLSATTLLSNSSLWPPPSNYI